MEQKVMVDFLAPLAVGSRVRLSFYSRNLGLFGDNWIVLEDKPLLEDLGTGILYGNEIILQQDPELRGFFSSEIKPEVKLVRGLVGVVRVCRIVATPGIKTSLVIEVESTS